jgi:signal transduction histidine kinase/ActR/RegA family two-component response regulator
MLSDPRPLDGGEADDSPRQLVLRTQQRLAALLALLVAALLIKHLTQAGRSDAGVFMAFALTCALTADWVLRRRGMPSELFTTTVLTGALLFAVVGVVVIHPNVSMYVVIAVPVLFIRLSWRVALLASGLAIVGTTFILWGYWRQTHVQLLHVPLGGGFLLLTSAIARQAMDRLYEQTARAREQAESLARQKDALMRTVSHEIRTPMNAVLGVTELALRDAPEPTLREALIRVRQNAQHLVSLANNFLDVSRIEEGYVHVELAPFAIAEVVDHVRDVLMRECRAVGLRAQVEVAVDLPAHVIGNRVGITQLLLNYISNALRFTKSGAIRVRLWTDVSPVHSGDVFLLKGEVQDTGTGLTADEQALLFRPFSQIGSSELRSGGTGLGLAICRWIAEQSGGAVGVTSAPGVGSTFWFSMQVEARDAAAGDLHSVGDPVAEPRTLDGVRVLVVDDEPMNLLVAGALLRRAGAEVEEASGGQLAVECVRRNRPDLVLMDIQMPDVDGVQALQQIRALSGGADLPVVALTARAGAAERQRLLDVGMSDYLVKPFDLEEIEELIWRWTRPQGSAAAHGHHDDQ